MTNRTNNEHNHQARYETDERNYRHHGRNKSLSPWFWLSAAALVIIPATAFAVITHDNFSHAMERQGCHIVNTFETGSHVWSCPRSVR